VRFGRRRLGRGRIEVRTARRVERERSRFRAGRPHRRHLRRIVRRRTSRDGPLRILHRRRDTCRGSGADPLCRRQAGEGAGHVGTVRQDGRSGLGCASGEQVRAEIGAWALSAGTIMSEKEFIARFGRSFSRFPEDFWPERPYAHCRRCANLRESARCADSLSTRPLAVAPTNRGRPDDVGGLELGEAVSALASHMSYMARSRTAPRFATRCTALDRNSASSVSAGVRTSLTMSKAAFRRSHGPSFRFLACPMKQRRPSSANSSRFRASSILPICARVFARLWKLDGTERCRFDHDFHGRAALEAEVAHPRRTVVTLRWNPDDVLNVAASHSDLLRPRVSQMASSRRALIFVSGSFFMARRNS
jgi:hypothetical protein